MELSNICEYSSKRIDSSLLTVENYVSTENMMQNKGGITLASKVPVENSVEFLPGDILISNIRPYFRKIWLSDKKGGCSSDVLCIRALPGTDSTYLYYLLSQDSFFDYVMSGAKGCKMPRGDKSQILRWDIDLPNLEEQHRIASILKSIDQKIELNNRINHNLEQQAQALYKSWFVDFEPFKDGKFVNSELGMIPEGWQVGNIYKYIDVISGAPYKSSLFNESKDGYPLVRIRDLKSFSPQFYTTERLPQTELVNSGDIVAGMDAEFIPCIWLGETGVLNQRCCKFVGKSPNISNLYVLHLVKPELEYVQSYKTGTTVSHLGKSDIDKFMVIHPEEAIVHQFSAICKPLFEEQIKCSAEIRQLTNLRDTLLPKLMSGELKINDLTC